MKPKLVVDVSVGISVTAYLREQGYDVVSVREVDPFAPDMSILEMAANQQRVVITMDKDFGELVYKSGRPHRGVLLLRLEEQDRETKVTVVSQILKTHEHELADHFCVYQNDRLRIRK